MWELEITFYLNEEDKNEYGNPSGVIAASCVIDNEVHCTGDVRSTMYTENVTLVFSDITKDGKLKKTLDDCVSIDVYKTEVRKVKCRVNRTHYDFLSFEKNTIDLWKK